MARSDIGGGVGGGVPDGLAVARAVDGVGVFGGGEHREVRRVVLVEGHAGELADAGEEVPHPGVELGLWLGKFCEENPKLTIEDLQRRYEEGSWA